MFFLIFLVVYWLILHCHIVLDTLVITFSVVRVCFLVVYN